MYTCGLSCSSNIPLRRRSTETKLKDRDSFWKVGLYMEWGAGELHPDTRSSLIPLLIRTHHLVRSCALSSRATGKMLSQWFVWEVPAPFVDSYLLDETLLTTFTAWTPNWAQHSRGLMLGYQPHLNPPHMQIRRCSFKVTPTGLGLLLSSSYVVGIMPP